jgi:hypothetical protein
MGRSTLVGLLLIFGALFVACDPGIGITIANDTDIPICAYFSGNYGDGKNRPNTTDPDYCNLVEPRETLGPIAVLCYSDSTKWVVLTLGVGGREIYARSATCGEWEDSGATVTVEEVDGRFVVTDSLPEGPASP